MRETLKSLVDTMKQWYGAEFGIVTKFPAHNQTDFQSQVTGNRKRGYASG